MGASTSVVVALFFVGFLIAAATTYSSVDTSQNLVKKAQQIQDTMKKAKIQTDITITNISYTNISYSGSYLNITLQNTGETTLNASLFEIFIDGVYIANFTLSPAGNTLVPGNNTTISLNSTVAGHQDATITIDNTGTYNDCGSWPWPSSCTSSTQSITNFAVSGTYRLLVVGVSYYTNPGTTNVKYNGVNLTLARGANNGNYYAELWYLINPPSGSYTIAQTQTTVTRVAMGAWSYTGVDQVTGIGNITNATSTSAKSNDSITTTAKNSVLVDVETDASSSLTAGGVQTQRYDDSGRLSNINGGGEDMSTTTIQTYNMNWTLGSSAAWVNIAAEIKPHTSLTGSRIKIVTENGISAYAIAP
jgi:archaellum component FlaF (FlaF/FlaG flagellin family)